MSVERDELRPQLADLLDEITYQLGLWPLADVRRTERIDAPATPAQKAVLAKLSPSDVNETELACDKITAMLTTAPGNGAPLGVLKVVTSRGWFAAIPSGTEDVYKIYAESFAGEEHLRRLEETGLRRVAITREEFKALPEDIWSVDFSGWPVFVREDLDEGVIAKFCAALEARKDRIPHYGTPGPLPLREMCTDTRDAPMMVPLHPVAERFWRQQGYL